MAVVPVCYKMPYKYHNIPAQSAIRQDQSGLACDCLTIPQGPRCSFFISSDARKRWQVLYPIFDILTTRKIKGVVNSSKGAILNQGALQFCNMTAVPAWHRVWNRRGEDFPVVWYAPKSSTSEKQLKLLDSYFGKLEGDENPTSSDSHDKTTESLNKRIQLNTKEELDSLNAYLGKLQKDIKSKIYASPVSDDQTGEAKPVVKGSSAGTNFAMDNRDKLKRFMELRNKEGDGSSGRSQSLQQSEETSDLYLISVLVSINIAVFLFEIASPVRNSDFELFSLPLLYGAKINDLIMVGEWWRLVTPMFLHSGVVHVALGCWSLLTFGPQVCRAYGPFAFFLIYMLGGISGNFTSFLHTPEPTVGGTGPIFSIIGAWLIYQMQNKDVVSKDVSENMFNKAIITTALSFILSNFGPIDDWTHLGAAFTGILYGLFTCPIIQLDDASSRTGQEEGIALVRGYADPCKSLVVFTIFTLLLGSLLFLVEPPLETLGLDDFA